MVAILFKPQSVNKSHIVKISLPVGILYHSRVCIEISSDGMLRTFRSPVTTSDPDPNLVMTWTLSHADKHPQNTPPKLPVCMHLQWRHMRVKTCQITGNLYACSTVCSGSYQSSTLLALCKRNPPVQGASNAESVSMSCHPHVCLHPVDVRWPSARLQYLQCVSTGDTSHAPSHRHVLGV